MISSIVLALLASAATRSTAAQAEPPRSRQELLQSLREKKRTELHPYEQNPVEKQFLRIDKAETPAIGDLNWKGFYPRIAWPARGSGVALGVRYWQRDALGPVDVAGAAFYSWRSYQHYDVQLGLLPHTGARIPGRTWKGDDLYEIGEVRSGFPRFPLYVTFRYRYLAEDIFYGLGPSASLEDRSDYLHEETRVYLTTGLQLARNVVWLVDGGFQANSIGAGGSSKYPDTVDVFDDTTAPGLSDPPDYVRFGTKLFFDFRDEPGNPHRGFMVALLGESFLDQNQDAFSFHRFGFDARGYIPLGSPQRVLALRAAMVFDQPRDGMEVPFFMQESLGGSHLLRGFDSFRFRAEKVGLWQAEYRWEPAPFWELAVFADTGSVARTDSSFSNLEWDYGFGMRFKSYRDVVIRLEIAFGRETTRYYFRGSTSF
jgi:hypothetical protein